ncbi:MAG: translation initiation factor IF-2 [Candidatus Aenigmarchaeota archaeon ex4484_56]|nr:MAG: translation initiation factor IF-2 [Candidatus Aenigmarchaeota archaeon ex4484_56]
MIRAPIVTVLGHVDHGKTTLLDYIRKTTVAEKEEGRITQDIGATDVPISLIIKMSYDYLKPIKNKIKIPGLLFIDTPGHLAFTSMREKGGAIADLAILVIDINEGIKPQTEESINILKKFRTPFVVGLTKIDKISNWRSENKDFVKNYELQNEFAKGEFEEKFYRIVGELSNYGFNSELFIGIKDFTKELAIVPCSGITGEGIPNLFTVLIGLSQKFLSLELSDRGRGVVLEVKKDEKLGNNMDVILYDGSLSVGDTLLFESKEPFEVKIRGLLKPAGIHDIRAEKKFINVDKVTAASGVKIIGKHIEKVVGGMNFVVIKSEKEKENFLIEKEKLCKEIETDREGIIIRSSTIGGLEALIKLFDNVKIKRAKIGPPTKEDLIALETLPEIYRVLICFNVDNPFADLAKNKDIKIICNSTIYKIYEEYEKWKKELEEKIKKRKLEKTKKIAKIKLIPGYVFRQSNPAVVGIIVLEGSLSKGTKIINKDGKIIGEIIQIQKEGKNIDTAEKDEKVAVSISKVCIGRQVKEGEVLYTFISKDEYRDLKSCSEGYPEDLLREIKNILNYL